MQQEYELHTDDAITWMRTLCDTSVDLIITDPPYESLEKHRQIGTTTRLKVSKASSNQWFSVFPNSRFPEFFTEAHRILKPDSHLYVQCDHETAFVIKGMGEEAGFKFWKPLVWDKKKIGMGYHYRARYEFILFFEKGKRRLNDLGIPDVLAVPRVHGGYPTEKPLELIETLIHQSSRKGEVVADPFMGSGTTGIAAVCSGRRFLGADISSDAVEIARGRLENALGKVGQQRLL